MSSESQVADHPEQLGRLAAVFRRRRIVLAVDGRRRSCCCDPTASWSTSVRTTSPSTVPRASRRCSRTRRGPSASGRRRGGLARVDIPGVEARRHPG